VTGMSRNRSCHVAVMSSISNGRSFARTGRSVMCILKNTKVYHQHFGELAQPQKKGQQIALPTIE
jgi:hypothetical protein